MTRLRELILQIHRRSLWQVVGIYLVGSWIAYQVVLGLVQGLGLPDWVPPVAIIMFVVGLPVVIATAFVQEGLPGQGSGPSEREPFHAGDPSLAAGRDTPAGALSESAPHALPTSAPAGGSGLAADSGAVRRHLTWSRSLVAGVLAFALLGVAVAGFMGMRVLGVGPAGSLAARGELGEDHTIVVAELEPLTGDTALARLVAEALRVDLSQSALLTVADRALVQHVLERMGRTGSDHLWPDVAREVATRLGLKALVEGEVGAAGGAYTVTARLVTPGSGRVLASFRETARDSTEILPAVDRLSRKLRERAGESLRTIRSDPPLTTVTTSSLPALRAFVEAQDAERRGERALAGELLIEALELDPEFAAAHRTRAVLFWNSGMRGDSMYHHAAEAVRLGDRLTERERLHAQAFYAIATDNLPAARRSYERLLGRDSADVSALINLGAVVSRQGDYDRAHHMARAAYDLGFRALLTTHWNLTFSSLNMGAPADALPFIDEADRTYPDHVSPVTQRWLVAMAMDDEDAAEAALRRMESNPDWAEMGRNYRILSDLRQGRLAAARAWMADVDRAAAAGGSPRPNLWLAIFRARIDTWVRLRADSAAARLAAVLDDHADAELPVSERPYPTAALLLAVGGETDRAREVIETFRAHVRPELLRQHTPMLGLAEGLADIVDGQIEQGLERVRAARGRGVDGCRACDDVLVGLAFELAARPDSAIAAYERYIDTPWGDRHRYPVPRRPPNDILVRAYTHERLGELHARTGDTESALRHYASFVDLWRDADPELRPRVEAAQRIIEQLAGEPHPTPGRP
jgi:eukaryotic-like serine/threonine-protein kinase